MSSSGSNQEGTPAWTQGDLQANPHEAEDKAGRVERMFDAIAGRYDLNNRLHSLGRDQSWRRTAASMADILATDRVLDVACGTGDLTRALARSGPASVTGVDFSGQMLRLARHKFKTRPLAPGLPPPRFMQGDAMDLQFEDDSFDVLTIAFGIRNVTDPAQAIAEFHRVLSPGGRLVILEFSEPGNRVLRFASNFYNRRVMPLTATLISGDRSGAYRYLPRSMETFATPDELAGVMAGAGFETITQRPLTFGICTVSRGIMPGTVDPAPSPRA